MSKRVKCDNCQKKEIESSSEGIYLGHYHDNNKDVRIHVCYDCYQDKEQEYLQNYAFIYSYNPDHYQKTGTGYLKTDLANCYAGKKDQNGQVLKQKDCWHCSPWKFTDNDSKEKCAECGKKMEGSFTGNGKTFCSFECIDTYRSKNPQQQEPPIIPPKNNNENGDTKSYWNLLSLR